MEFVKNNEIVLNISAEACHQLHIENDWISFQARFGGIPKKVLVPVTHVLAIYSRENGQGMSFPFDPEKKGPVDKGLGNKDALKAKSERPALKLVK
jgi:stringent starvation protein B